MMTASSSVSLVGAVLGAGAYSRPLFSAERESARSLNQMRRTKLLGTLRDAQVHLYCDHTADAMAGIRAAQADLPQAGLEQDTSTIGAALARAAWLARHHQYHAAHEELEDARHGIALHD